MNVITNVKYANSQEVDSIRVSWRNIPEKVYKVTFSDGKIYLVYRIDEPKHVRVSQPWEAINLETGFSAGHYQEDTPVPKAIKKWESEQNFIKAGLSPEQARTAVRI
jgi:hypothetical protein